MARAPTQKELAAFIVGHGITDFITGGRLSLIERNALWKVIKKLGPPAVTTTGRLAGTAAMSIPRLAGTVARGARFVAMRHPYIATAVVVYEVAKNREQIAELAREGWEIIDEPVMGGLQYAYDAAEAAGVYDRPPGIQAPSFTRPLMEKLGLPTMPKRKKSKFNRAVSAAMKAVKASTKGGRKGKISNPKATFKAVSKVVSKVSKGSRVPLIGVSGIAGKAAKKIYGKIKKSKKKPKRRASGYTITVNQ